MTWLRVSISVVVVVASSVWVAAQVPATPGFNAASYGGSGAPKTNPVPTTGARGAQAWQRIYVDGKMMVVPAVPRGKAPGMPQTGEAPQGDSVTPLPYLQYRRTITGRVQLAPYAPGYIFAPQDKPKHVSAIKSTFAAYPACPQDQRQTIYLDYYDQMPEVLSNNIKASHIIRGVPMPEWGKAFCPGCGVQLPSPLVWHDGACPQCAGYEDTAIKPGEAMRTHRANKATPSPRFEVVSDPAAATEPAGEEEPAGTASSRHLPF
ncbi:MAG: hypothetical protein ACRC46_02490 [Thermoguttaceae bacterium]